MNLTTVGRDIVRGVTPIALGAATGFAAKHGLDSDYAGAVGTAVAIAYSTLVRLAEKRWPKAGHLLGAVLPSEATVQADVTKDVPGWVGVADGAVSASMRN